MEEKKVATEEISGNEEDNQPSRGVLSAFDWFDSLALAVIVVVLLFSVVFRIPEVFGTSMLPNFEEKDRVLISCLERDFNQNDVVVVDARGTQLGERIIKRVIATEGQTVDIDFASGVVYVDGEPLDESAYIENGSTTHFEDMQFPQVVPEGCVFVLGDNRDVSMDSRSTQVGMIDTRYIIGKVRAIVFPFDHFRLFF
mgnify:FL=1